MGGGILLFVFQINYLKQALHDERLSHGVTQRNLTDLDKCLHDLQVKYNEQLRIMMTSYDASERANKECDSRIGIFDRQVTLFSYINVTKYINDTFSVTANIVIMVYLVLLENIVTKFLLYIILRTNPFSSSLLPGN